MRVLVTGGAGFIGSAVVAALSDAGHDVLALDCLHPAAHGGAWPADPAPYGITRVVGDLRDRRTVEQALCGADAVVHQAAMVGLGMDLDDLPEYVSCNNLATAVLLAAMATAGVRRLVLASSMVVYGEGAYSCPRHGSVRPAPRTVTDLAAGRFEPRCPRCRTPLVADLVGEEAPADPRSVYAATKVAQEHLATAWANECAASVVALRYHNVYGPGMPRDTPYAGVAAIFRSSLERGEPPQVFEDGGQRRDFVHVTDVARANVAALSATADRPGLRAFNIASGERHTVADMAAALTDAFGGPAPVVTGRFRAGDVRHIVADPERARRELGFVAGIAFKQGMAGFATAPLRSRRQGARPYQLVTSGQ